ncbi:MAG: cation:proton antiporter [Candidatus Aenigmarchaeota archaeon]|nr:cation:proton antiporter [Candidatus Aenigmarchaeota archaeon]
MSDALIAITYFAILLGLGVLLANFFKKRNIPDSIFLILLGLLLGPTILGNPFIAQYMKIEPVSISAMGAVPDFLRILALIMIVFAGMFNVGLRSFRKTSGISVKFAVLGVAFNTIILGVAAHFIFGIDWVFALLLGGVLSGTADAIIFTFDSILDKDYRRVMTMLKTEAVFNSPMCILIPLVFLDFVSIQPGAIIEPMAYFSKFVLMMVAGVGAGIILGLGFSKLVKRMAQDYTVLLMLSIALLTYAASEYVGGSGILAVAICGLIVGDMGFQEKDDVKRFDDHFSEMLRIAVFTFLGAQVTLTFGLSDIIPILLFFIAIVLARPLFVNIILGKERKNYTKQERFVMSFVAPRGIDAAAMAPIVAAALIAANLGAAAASIMNMVVVVIILTVIFSTFMAKFAASSRFAGGQLSVKNYANRETVEEKEEELEDEIEHEEERPSKEAASQLPSIKEPDKEKSKPAKKPDKKKS